MNSDLASYLPHVIAGKACTAGTTGETVQSCDPYTGEMLWQGTGASSALVDEAVQAARQAFPGWAALGFDGRLALMQRFVDLVKQHAEPLTDLIAREAGKPIWESKAEASSLVTKLAASVDAYKLRAAESSREVRGLKSRTRFLPHGVVAVLGPFNFPASMANSHITPALLAGNTVVFKPSELTPLTGLYVARLWQEAGLPAGVLNCVSGARATGAAMVEHPDVNGVLMVGSHAAGLAILKTLATVPQKMVALEMGGNSPLVVWDYENLDAVVSIVVQSAFMSGGQRCSAARRLLVREEDTLLLPRLVEVLRKLRIGDFRQRPEPYYGPLIRPNAAERTMRRTAELVATGGELLLEPRMQGPISSVVTPGLLAVDGCRDNPDEEIFGPVLKVQRYRSFDQAIGLANATKFGLAAGIVCTERARYEEFFRAVPAGIVNWNQQLTGATTLAPFGGIKQSGNFRPAGFMSVDYCSYAVASFEVEKPAVPDPVPAGITF